MTAPHFFFFPFNFICILCILPNKSIYLDILQVWELNSVSTPSSLLQMSHETICLFVFIILPTTLMLSREKYKDASELDNIFLKFSNFHFYRRFSLLIFFFTIDHHNTVVVMSCDLCNIYHEYVVPRPYSLQVGTSTINRVATCCFSTPWTTLNTTKSTW